MANNQEFLRSIEAIDAAVPDSAGKELALPDLGELCKVFNKIKGPLEVIIPIIELIPVYGSAVAKALRLLLSFGSKVCTA